MAVSDQLKDAIVNSGATHYRIGKDTGVSVKSIDWFVSGERPYLRSDTIDKLCEYFGLELSEKKTGTAVKQTGKRPATKRKRAKKRAE